MNREIFFAGQAISKGKNVVINKDAGNMKPYIPTSAWNLDMDHSSTGNDSGFANEQ